jgi:hypothetical protein
MLAGGDVPYLDDKVSNPTKPTETSIIETQGLP